MIYFITCCDLDPGGAGYADHCLVTHSNTHGAECVVLHIGNKNGALLVKGLRFFTKGLCFFYKRDPPITDPLRSFTEPRRSLLVKGLRFLTKGLRFFTKGLRFYKRAP